MRWSPIEWDLPMIIKVPLVALLFCVAVAVILGAIFLGVDLIADRWGEDAAAGTFIAAFGFGLVCLFTWIVLDTW